jgi:hypothetical protein
MAAEMNASHPDGGSTLDFVEERISLCLDELQAFSPRVKDIERMLCEALNRISSQHEANRATFEALAASWEEARTHKDPVVRRQEPRTSE